MIMTFLGGVLAHVRWNWNYLVYLLAVPGFVLSLCGIETDCHTSADCARQEQYTQLRGQRACFGVLIQNKKVRGTCLCAFLITLFFSTLLSNISMFVAERGLGTDVETGMAVSFAMLSGACGGICFGQIAKRMKHNIVAFGFWMLTGGQLICCFSYLRCITYFGCFVGGFSISLVMPQTILEASEQLPGSSEHAASLCMASSNLGALFAPALTVVIQFIMRSGTAATRLGMSALFTFLAGTLVYLSRSKSNAYIN